MSEKPRAVEKPCYECGKLTTRYVWKSRCLTCVVQKLEFNLYENGQLRKTNQELLEALEFIKKTAEINKHQPLMGNLHRTAAKAITNAKQSMVDK